MSLVSTSTVGGKTKYKIVLLGDQHVGKTSIIDRFINDKFETTYSATIGIDFLVRNLTHQNKTYRLQLWDTAGQERFKSLIPSYLKDSNLAIITYDVNNLKSFESVEKWIELYNNHKQYNAFCIVVGNKKDVTIRQCTDAIIEQKMNTTYKDTKHFLVSAKTGEGIQDLFLNVIDLITAHLADTKIIDQIDEKQEQDQTAKPSTVKESYPVKLAKQQVQNEEDKRKQKVCC